MRCTWSVGLAIALAWPVASPQVAETAKRSNDMRGGAFNLRVISDSVPDWSSRENFVYSALSGWRTDHEKALAQFRWSYRCRRVGSFVEEDSRPVVDPILFFNSYGITFCNMISEINCALWEARGLPSRCVTLPGHCVAEVYYDNAWHLFDNDFCNYFLNEAGAVASAEELTNSRIHGNVQDLRPGEFYVFDHCPTASFPRGRIFMGPSSWSVPEIARDWYPGRDGVRPRNGFICSHAGHRFVLGLRPNESYTRHWRPLGTGLPYARLFRDGKDPAADGGSPLRNCRSNGEWVWQPDLADSSVPFASENVEHTRAGLKARDPAEPASAVFRVMAANVVTSARLEAEYAGNPGLAVSGNGGHSWEPVGLISHQAGAGRAALDAPVAGRLEYLVKVDLGKGAALKTLRLDTITQVNPRVLPALRLGRNEIVAVSDRHLEYLTLNPRLTNGQHLKEVYKADGWQALDRPAEYEPSLRAPVKAELVLRAAAPRDIRHVRLCSTLHVRQSETEIIGSVSFDGGKTWLELGRQGYTGAPYDHRVAWETREAPAGTREALLRLCSTELGNGVVNVFAEVGYDPASGLMPYDLTYSWSEWRDGQWLERRHIERVKDADHRYAINVGGERPPKMNWLRLSPAGEGKDGTPGYSDGRDVGDNAARPAYSLTYGRKLSEGCTYELSRPASAALPDTGGKLLTDGYVGLASFWGLSGIELAGKKNEKRVGELAVWEPGGELAVTIDLGKVEKVGGARVCAVQPNAKVLFPARMAVEVSADGRTFASAGEAAWEECFFPPADFPVWEGTDSPIYAELPAGGILDHKFPILFRKQAQARYVRFRLSSPTDPKAGIGLWELEVYDRIEKLPWDEHLLLPKAADPRKQPAGR